MENIKNLKNSSLSGEDIFLLRGRSYFVIDALYLNDIKDKIDKLDSNNLPIEIRGKVFGFPRTDTPFTILTIAGREGVEKISPSDVIKGKNDDDRYELFATDTGLVVFIDEAIILDVIRYLDYGDLVDSITDSINKIYWSSLYDRYEDNQLGLILAPGVDSGYEFEGGGVYKIRTNS